jgi:hypothetical protein
MIVFKKFLVIKKIKDQFFACFYEITNNFEPLVRRPYSGDFDPENADSSTLIHLGSVTSIHISGYFHYTQ